MFRKYISPPLSRSKNKPSNLLQAGFSLALFFNTEEEEKGMIL
jgi:hypothetical protein